MNSDQSALYAQIATSISASAKQVTAAVSLLDSGDTVPFISRYRKEVTGGLTDTQLRDLEQRLAYLRDFNTRRATIITAIEEQGALSDELRQQLMQAQTKSELEDLYLPFKKKRKTKGQMAIAAGLEPLANSIWQQPDTDPHKAATAYVSKDTGVDDEKAALDGARAILIERFAEDAALLKRLRNQLENHSYLCAQAGAKTIDKEIADKFKDYVDHQEPFAKVPGHRALAMFRGRSEGALSLRLLLKTSEGFDEEGFVTTVANHLGFENKQRPADVWREQVVSWVWKVKLSVHLETELFTQLKLRADEEAIDVFAANLKDLLLSAPAGSRTTLGLDPGYRSGVKTCVVDAHGTVLNHCTIYPHAPQRQWQQALESLVTLCKAHQVELIAVGNGTASRETEKLADEVIKLAGLKGLTKVVVSEAGASVYSASKIAETEFPELDVTIRGAVSIARRLQDPLAELVKIDPKAIGVGQYQHDVSQPALARSLETTVEDCVNSVGVNLETASAALLTRVSGLSATLADNIVQFREAQGGFDSRAQLKKVPRLGPKAFEQCAGFLRINNGSNPLDASAVHPESYPVVKRILQSTERDLKSLIGDTAFLQTLNASEFTDERVGEPTVRDILSELEKPGRDPRPDFVAVKFTDGVENIKDLTLNQVLEGQITNVTAFGAFVDVGVHQDGLVHISALSNTFVKDPRSVVKAGDVVKVKVMSVDVARNRIGLSMRLTDDASAGSNGGGTADGNMAKGQRNARTNSRSGERHTKGNQQRQKPKGSQKSNQLQRDSAAPESALALSLAAAITKRDTSS